MICRLVIILCTLAYGVVFANPISSKTADILPVQDNIVKQSSSSEQKLILFGVLGIGLGHISRGLPQIKHFLHKGDEVIVFYTLWLNITSTLPKYIVGFVSI